MVGRLDFELFFCSLAVRWQMGVKEAPETEKKTRSLIKRLEVSEWPKSQTG